MLYVIVTKKTSHKMVNELKNEHSILLSIYTMIAALGKIRFIKIKSRCQLKKGLVIKSQVAKK